MKRIYILRHGQAEKAQDAFTDQQRTLTLDGRRHILEMAASLKGKKPVFDLLIVSPAIRARQTAELVITELAIPHVRIITEKIFYTHASIDIAMGLLQKINDEVTSILLVAHNPLLEELAGYLCLAFTQKMHPGMLVSLYLPADHWRHIQPGSGTLDYILSP